MQNERNQELTDLRAEMRRLGAALGLSVRIEETSVEFAQRCVRASRALKAGAGVTWVDYELIKAHGREAIFALKMPPESSPLGGPRWRIEVGQGLEQLAERLGMYEEAATT